MMTELSEYIRAKISLYVSISPIFLVLFIGIIRNEKSFPDIVGRLEDHCNVLDILREISATKEVLGIDSCI